MTIDVRTLADDVWAVIHNIPATTSPVTGLFTYRNELVDPDTLAPVEPALDQDGRVHPYAVVYFSTGSQASDRMTATPNRLPWTFQVSCVGGDDTRALWAVTQIRDALTGLTLRGGRLTEVPTDLQRVDSNIQPPRTVRDLIYRLHARN